MFHSYGRLIFHKLPVKMRKLDNRGEFENRTLVMSHDSCDISEDQKVNHMTRFGVFEMNTKNDEFSKNFSSEIKFL